MSKRVWINQDPNREDIQRISQKLNAAGFDSYVKNIRGNSREHVSEAMNVDCVLASLEQWDKDALDTINGKVSLIVRKGVGYDSVDIDAATENGIAVMNLPGANATAVAEVAMMHILNCSRHFSWSMRQNYEDRPIESFKGHELDTATIGILGFGNIGKELARMLSGFNSRILVYDSFYTPAPINNKMEIASSMEELFRESDYVSIHIPCVAETENLIDERFFRIMKKTAYIINTSRGGVLNEADLISAVHNKDIAGAGLDVTKEEPLSLESPLLKETNIWVTPHIAGNTVEAVEKQNDMAVQSIISFFNGEKPRNIINPEYCK